MPPGDVEALYGVDIHEMQPVWNAAQPDPASNRAKANDAGGARLLYLPDTAATDYLRNHVKSTVAIEAINQEAETLRYFHNTGLHELSKGDYRGVFGLNGRPAEMLPPYLEVVRFDAGEALKGEALRASPARYSAAHLDRRPTVNPLQTFGEQLAVDLPRLLEGDGHAFHAYAFATVRMAGASFDLLRTHVDWLIDAKSAGAFDPIVEGCQILSFRLARRKAFDPTPAIAEMAEAWEEAIAGLDHTIS